MFTGIIADIGRITQIDATPTDQRWRIVHSLDFATDVALGASICCSGMCLTVIAFGTQDTHAYFDADVAAESIAVTVPRIVGDGLNLERSLRPSSELGGHIVSGHVDGIATVTRIYADGAGWRVHIAPPAHLLPFIAPKGSITIDGVSLTVNGISVQEFDIMIVPHTYTHTTFAQYQVGTQVNIEVDMLARYVARQLSFVQKVAP